MENAETARVSSAYEAELERALQALRKRKKELEDELEQVRFKAMLLQNRVAKLCQQMRNSAASPDADLSTGDSLQIMTDAYRSVNEAEPILPPPGSVLPALLAIRRAQQTIDETNESVDSRSASLEVIERRIESEQVNVREQQALKAALESRIQSLREGFELREEKTEEQKMREEIAELKRQVAHWESQTSKIMKELDWFIDEYLGPMLAAEELGGPVVGGLMDIDADDLGAGFSAQGKPKTAKAQPDQDKRQRRLDDIWGPPDQQGPNNKRKHERDEASAAGAEMRDLTEQLLNKVIEAGGDTSAAYIEISRESAAARFLVRSKIAVFHPRDARRLRLVDFGRDLAD